MGSAGDPLGKFIKLALQPLGRVLLQGPLAIQKLKGKGNRMDSLKTGYSRSKLDQVFRSTKKNKTAGQIGSISGIQNFVARPSYPPK